MRKNKHLQRWTSWTRIERAHSIMAISRPHMTSPPSLPATPKQKHYLFDHLDREWLTFSQNAHQWPLIKWYCWYGWSWMYFTVTPRDSCYPTECQVLHVLAILYRSFKWSDLIGLKYCLFMFKRNVLFLYKATTLQSVSYTHLTLPTSDLV